MKNLVCVVAVIVLSTIAYGVYSNRRAGDAKKFKKALGINLAVFVPTLVVALIAVIPQAASAAEATSVASSASGLGYIGAALSTGLAALGTGIAVGNVGSSAIGAVSEDPSMFGKTLIFIGLAEGIAIYGLIISIMILGSI